MTREITSFLNTPVYTRKGIYVGEIKRIILDTDSCKLDKMVIGNANPSLMDEPRDLAVPYRWVSAAGDIIILRYFPEEISIKEEEKRL